MSAKNTVDLTGKKLYLSKLEEELFDVVEVGDVAGVVRLIRDNEDLDVNVKDNLGRTPLSLATQNQHEEVAKVLIDRSSDVNIYDSLLQAISIESTEIAEAILDHYKWPSVKCNCQGHSAPLNSRSTYSRDMTPLIMAAHNNFYPIVRKLLLMGESLEKPHSPICDCESCQDANKELDRLARVKSRLATWRALSSEAYISLSSLDPILTAFLTSKEIRLVTKRESHYKGEYDELIDKLEGYPADLLDHIRSDEEVVHVMNRATKSEHHDYIDKPPRELARIKLAMHYDQKKFVAHSMSHRKVTNVMYGDLHHLQASKPHMKLLYVLGFLVLYPVFVGSYLFLPCSRIGHMMKVPIVKLTSHAISYLLFLSLVIAFSFIEKNELWKDRVRDLPDVQMAYDAFTNSEGVQFDHVVDKIHTRKETPSPLYILICLYIGGNLFGRCIQIYQNGIRSYKERFYNLLDTVALACYLITISCKWYAHAMKSTTESFFSKEEGWRSLHHGDKEAMKYFTLLTSDRYLWAANDPEYIGEGFFSIANVLTFIKGTYLLMLDENLGPLQLSLGLMVKDILRFTCILGIFIVGFLVALHNLYWYFSPEVIETAYMPTKADYNTILNSAGVTSFGGFSVSVQTIFWAIFGMDNADSTSLEGFQADFTETIGVMLFAAYNWVMVVLLLNMLIALMSQSLDYVTEDKDLEWKYGLTVLYMDYIQHGSTVPPPFNLLPNPQWIFNTATCHKCKSKENESEASSNRENVYISEVPSHSDSHPKDPYEEVIKRIVDRYIRHQIKNKSTVSLEELKQDVSSFRYEILNKLKNSNKEVKDDLQAIKEEQKIITEKLELFLSHMEGNETLKNYKVQREKSKEQMSKL